MTEKELLDNGYNKFNAKIGVLYTNNGFFCSLNQDGIVDYRHSSNDMKSLGKASSMKEIKELERNYYVKQKELLNAKILMLDIIIAGYDEELKNNGNNTEC